MTFALKKKTNKSSFCQMQTQRKDPGNFLESVENKDGTNTHHSAWMNFIVNVRPRKQTTSPNDITDHSIGQERLSGHELMTTRTKTLDWTLDTLSHTSWRASRMLFLIRLFVYRHCRLEPRGGCPLGWGIKSTAWWRDGNLKAPSFIVDGVTTKMSR